MLARTEYPAGVPCWVDLLQPDVDRAFGFYRDLFGWAYQVRTPEGAPQRYAYAVRDGLVVGGLGGPPGGDAAASGWTSFVAVASADETAAAVTANGGRVLAPPTDIPGAGRSALCADPQGAVFGLWQAGGNPGAQLVNAPGSWNFSEIATADPAGAEKFYEATFGWVCQRFEYGPGQAAGFWRLPGYGDFLAASDPEIAAWQDDNQAPDGFADAVALLRPVDDGEDGGEGARADARWTVTFAVADADAAVARATELGATAVTPMIDTRYTRMATVRDPQGAELTLSEYRPPAD